MLMLENIYNVSFKKCPHCKENKILSEYYKQTTVCKICKKNWYIKNKESICNKEKIYRNNNKEKISNRKKNYDKLEIVKVKKRITSSKYYYKNKEQIFKYKKEKYKNDPIYKLIHNTRRRIQKLLTLKNIKKQNSTHELIGCTPKELKIYLEKQFKEGMTWNNHSIRGWHIDHIKPCSLFNLVDIEEQKQCFHYTNLQPLWWYENLYKSNKF